MYCTGAGLTLSILFSVPLIITMAPIPTATMSTTKKRTIEITLALVLLRIPWYLLHPSYMNNLYQTTDCASLNGEIITLHPYIGKQIRP